MVLRPVGPMSPGVYWFRRLLVLAVVLVVVWSLYRWLAPGGESAPQTPAASSSSSSPVSTPTMSPTEVTTSAPATQSAKPSKSGSSPTPTLPTCRDRDISVTVATDAEVYPAGQEPQFTLTVSNQSDQSCLRDLGAAALELRVSSGGARVWSSDDCNPGGGDRLSELKPGDPYTQTVTWSRQTSEVGCPSPQQAADPGTYQVLARNLDVLSEPAQFTLE